MKSAVKKLADKVVGFKPNKQFSAKSMLETFRNFVANKKEEAKGMHLK